MIPIYNRRTYNRLRRVIFASCFRYTDLMTHCQLASRQLVGYDRSGTPGVIGMRMLVGTIEFLGKWSKILKIGIPCLNSNSNETLCRYSNLHSSMHGPDLYIFDCFNIMLQRNATWLRDIGMAQSRTNEISERLHSRMGILTAVQL